MLQCIWYRRHFTVSIVFTTAVEHCLNRLKSYSKQLFSAVEDPDLKRGDGEWTEERKRQGLSTGPERARADSGAAQKEKEVVKKSAAHGRRDSWAHSVTSLSAALAPPLSCLPFPLYYYCLLMPKFLLKSRSKSSLEKVVANKTCQNCGGLYVLSFLKLELIFVLLRFCAAMPWKLCGGLPDLPIWDRRISYALKGHKEGRLQCWCSTFLVLWFCLLNHVTSIWVGTVLDY